MSFQKQIVTGILAVCTLLSLSAGSALADWYVDDDAPFDPAPGDPGIGDPLEDGTAEHPFDAIQEGIDAAQEGDVVIVRNGLYAGLGNRELDFYGKAVTLRSENGPAECVIDCEERGRGFYFHTNESHATVLEGFTIQRASDMPAVHCNPGSPTILDCRVIMNRDGAIYCSESSPIVISCEITDNTTIRSAVLVKAYSNPLFESCVIARNIRVGPHTSGGGIDCSNHSSPRFISCIIAENEAESVLARGGGIRCSESNMALIRCTIVNNSAEDGLGGGIFLYQNFYQTPLIFNCTIAGNQTRAGGGIYCYESNAVIANCAIRDNHATDATVQEFNQGGGGVYSYDSDPQIVNCTIAGNTTALYGGGVLAERLQGPALTNCILWNNTAVSGSQIGLVGPSNYPPSIAVAYCDVSGGAADVLLLANSTLIWGAGNLDVDPQFVDPDGADDDPATWEDNVYALVGGSPCNDAGHNISVPRDTLDIDQDGNVLERIPYELTGRLRFSNDPIATDSGVPDLPNYPEIVDMGAYEFIMPGDIDGDGDLDGIDFDLFLDTYGHCMGESVFCIEADLDEDGCITLIDYQLWMRRYRDYTGNPGASAPTLGIPGDLNGDSRIDLSDLAAFLANYGISQGATFVDGDFNSDGAIDISDLAILLAVYGVNVD